MDGLFLNYSYFARLGHAVPSICVIAVHKITERDAGHWSTSADAANQPAQMGEHLSLIHISEPTRLGMISYAVFCLKKKKKKKKLTLTKPKTKKNKLKKKKKKKTY